MPEPKKAGPLRLVMLLVVLGLALALSFVDGSAVADCQARLEKIERALVGDRPTDDATIAEWMGKTPDRAYDGEDKRYFEEFDFRGIVRRRTIVVEYMRGATKLVHAVSVK